jgi:hypothetical protein
MESGFVIWQEIQAEAKAVGCLRPNISTTTTGAELLISRFPFSHLFFVHLSFGALCIYLLLNSFEVLQNSPSKQSSISFCTEFSSERGF